MEKNGVGKIDENLYSRQLYVIGHEAMKKMSLADVLVCGLGGIGVEIAKNLILSGVRSVTLQDEKTTTMEDLSTQFYLNESCVGGNRAEKCIQQLRFLNENVNVSAYTKAIDRQLILRHTVVVVTDYEVDKELEVAKLCNLENRYFIAANSRGLFGKIFCDFGKNFQVIDVDGNQIYSCIISDVSDDGVVLCIQGSRHNLQTGDLVKFSEIIGMEGLDNCVEPFKVTVIASFSFKVEGIDKYGKYISGGVFTTVKKKEIIHFNSMEESIKKPNFVHSDFAKMDSPPTLHVAFTSLAKYISDYNRYPKAFNKKDSQTFITISKQIAQDLEITLSEDDVSLLEKFSFVCTGRIIPLASVIGSIASQEVLKACTSKFMPIRQWFYFDAIECILDWATHIEKMQNFTLTKSVYMSQEVVFGSEFQNKLFTSNSFIVGSGAIGCEMLKNMAFMGISSKKQGGGKITLTDMDSIELSNLSRQFLFRRADIQQMKSKVAASCISSMNSNVNIEHMVEKVGSSSEHIFNDPFYEKLDIVVNALDNVESRLYMDRKCVFHLKPLVDSGTLGTAGNVQVVIPHLTESYGSSQDPPEKSIPMCTIKNFPYKIEHTIQWSRSFFEDLFTSPAEKLNKFIQNRSEFLKNVNLVGYQSLSVLQEIKEKLITNFPANVSSFILMARKLFDQHFTHQIAQLLFNFPADQVSSKGNLFWSSPKKCPQIIYFNVENEKHVDFIMATANIYAHIFKYSCEITRNVVIENCKVIKLKEFIPMKGVRIAVNDTELENSMQGYINVDQNALEAVIKDLELLDLSKIPLTSVSSQEFEKDDPTNYHMDFILAAANLRANNYSIQETDMHECKLVAGKIIPAIATTTSLVSGLVSLEIYKILAGCNDIDKLKNGFVNIALPLFAFSSPIEPVKMDCKEADFTLWDRFQVEEKLTLAGFIKYMKNKHNVTVTSISCGVVSMYMCFMPKSKGFNEKLETEIAVLYQTLSKEKLGAHVNYLVLEALVEESNDLPFIKYKVHK